MYGTMKTASVKRRYLGTIQMQEAEQNIRKVGDFALYHKVKRNGRLKITGFKIRARKSRKYMSRQWV